MRWQQNLVEPRQPVGLFEQFLPLQMHQGGQVAGDEIGQAGGFDDLRGGGGEVVGEVGRGGNDLLKQADHVLPQRFHLGREGGIDFLQLFDARPQERLGGRELAYTDARGALAEQQQVLARHADGLVHHAKGADFIQVLRLRRIHARIELRDDRQGAAFAHALHQRHRTGAADGDGQHRAGVEHDIAHRQNRYVFEQPLSRVGHSPSVARGGARFSLPTPACGRVVVPGLLHPWQLSGAFGVAAEHAQEIGDLFQVTAARCGN